MTSAILFLSNFLLVALLGMQQINVERRNIVAAMSTNLLIGGALLLQFKVLPGPTSMWDAAAFIFGGSFGIATSIVLHPVLVDLFARQRTAATEIADSAWSHFEEMQALGQEIADDRARRDVENYCTFDKIGRFTWYDIKGTRSPEEQHSVDRAVRYLDLRRLLVRHPVQTHMVRLVAI